MKLLSPKLKVRDSLGWFDKDGELWALASAVDELFDLPECEYVQLALSSRPSKESVKIVFEIGSIGNLPHVSLYRHTGEPPSPWRIVAEWSTIFSAFIRAAIPMRKAHYLSCYYWEKT